MASPESTTASKPDYRNGDLVSRLLAATPPYLYNMPLVPQSFFFSEMLRSFVQAKTASTNQNSTPNIGQRRGRKRTWRESKQSQPAVISEKPLELTTTPRSPPPPKPSCSPPIPTAPPTIPPPPPPILLPPIPSQSNDIQSTAPLWYPPMYTPPNLPSQPPPYSFDPLHFFIDLRVSGHIWDRKPDSTKEQIPSPSEPLNLQTEDKKNGLNIDTTFRQRKHVSAFSVPQPRDISMSNNNSSSNINNSKDVVTGTGQKSTNISTNYVLQNLSKIYQEVKASKDSSSKKDEELSPEEKKCKDIRELIGLELVVDYVNHEDGPIDKDKTLMTGLKQEAESENTQDLAVDD
ncbi:uncharacterized protein LOC142317674 [Lycorma delicatula]|uniref:uncharacterized protein LOC142317674 n=1 Tax=Lycorma delicatula TaxID=130591 RepID=UPI003F5147FB